MVVSNFKADSRHPQVLPQSARRTQRHQKTKAGIGTVLNSVPLAIFAVINREIFRPCHAKDYIFRNFDIGL